jgi:hypothetical protein
VLHVFDAWGNGVMKAWDWKDGWHMLGSIADYEGEWYGPITGAALSKRRRLINHTAMQEEEAHGDT